MIIKKDIPIIQEFLGTLDVLAFVSPFKCVRTYCKKVAFGSPFNVEDYILILTPTIYEDEEFVNDKLIFFMSFSKYAADGKDCKTVWYQIGKNRVYTFKVID